MPLESTARRSPHPERRGPADRRLGERRLQLVTVTVERRARSERRAGTGRRESASGHVRNAIQLLESALADSELHRTPVDQETVAAAAQRLRQALRELDRLYGDRVTLGLLLRVQERGLPPDALPGLEPWPV
jgi:hypothetical protein